VTYNFEEIVLAGPREGDGSGVSSPTGTPLRMMVKDSA